MNGLSMNGRPVNGRPVNGLRTAIAVEVHKARAARVVIATSVIVIAGITILASAFILAARGGNAAVLAKLGSVFADGIGWTAYLSTVAQVTAAGSLLAFGVVISWMLGREFTDGTITGLFGLPVSRTTIALAKLLVYLLWAALVAVALAALLLVVGLLLNLGPLDTEAFVGLGRQLALTLLTALVAVPAAWAATLGRGLLAGIGTSVGIMATAQVMAVAGIGAWFPVAAPALWAIAPNTVPAPALALVATVPLVFGGLTLLAWHRLQLDR